MPPSPGRRGRSRAPSCARSRPRRRAARRPSRTSRQMRRVAATRSGSCRCSQRSFGPDRLLRDARARARAAPRSAPSSARSSSISRVGAAVVVEQRRPQRLVVGVEQQQARHAAGDADRGHVAAASMPAAAHTSGTIAIAAAEPVARVGLRVRRAGRGRVVAARDAPRRCRAAGSSSDGLQRGRADVEAEQHLSGRRSGRGQEPAHAVAVDRVPRAAVGLEVGADDDAVDERQERADVARLGARVEQHRRASRRPRRPPRARPRGRARTRPSGPRRGSRRPASRRPPSAPARPPGGCRAATRTRASRSSAPRRRRRRACAARAAATPGRAATGPCRSRTRPGMTSRMKLAPVATATASAHRASHR